MPLNGKIKDKGRKIGSKFNIIVLLNSSAIDAWIDPVAVIDFGGLWQFVDKMPIIVRKCTNIYLIMGLWFYTGLDRWSNERYS